MKQEEFLDLMDGVSEEYIAEMMNHRHSRHISSGKEITKMNQSCKTGTKEIRISRRSVAAGSAVAAALLALNIGGVFLLHHGAEMTNPGTDSSSETEVTTDIAEAITTDISSESEPEEEQLPAYVEYMRRYYEGLSEESVDFDYTRFIGFGTDLNETWEDEDYRITIKAAVGCDWMIYYFFDAERKSDAEKGLPIVPPILLAPSDAVPNRTDTPAYSFAPMPGTGDDENAAFCQYYGILTNTTDQPFFHKDGKPVSRDFLFFSPYYSFDESTGESDLNIAEIATCTFDFSAEEYPLRALDPPQKWSDLARRPGDMDEVLTANGHGAAFIMTRFAETPFGLYYVSDPYRTADWDSLEHSLSGACGLEGDNAIQRDPDGNPLRTFKTTEDTSYGVNMSGESGLGFLCAVFSRPLDLAQGSVSLAFSEQEPWPDWGETGVNEDGLSYGQASDMLYGDQQYDLVFIPGDSGNAGYAYVSDLIGTEYLEKKDMLHMQPEDAEPVPDENAETVTVNVYRNDGKTLIDTVTLRKVN